MVAHGPLASFGIAETANILHPMNHKPYNLKFDGSKACLSALHDFIICWGFPVSTSRSVAGCLLGARPWRRSWENSSSCRPAQWRKQNHKQTWQAFLWSPLKQNQFWGSCWASPLWNSSGRGAEIMDVVVSVPQQDWLWQMKMISTWDFPAEPTGFGYLMTKRYQDWLWLHMWTNILMDKTAVLWTSYGLFFFRGKCTISQFPLIKSHQNHHFTELPPNGLLEHHHLVRWFFH